jgi:dTDP-4-dehydrorhamnose reductase
MEKKIYIAGGAGMLGEAFYRQFSPGYELKITDIDVNEPWVGELDFRDEKAYRDDVRAFRPDYLFHLGAHTDLEYCETHAEDAYATNTAPVESAIRISRELDIPLLYISTAGIFDGKKEVYDDWDEPNPIGHYARSKWLGEKMVVEQKDRYLVCRAGWMMGGGPGKDKKFVGKILQQIRSGRHQLEVVDDKFGTPTYTHDFASTVNQLLVSEAWGLYNMACQGVTDRVEVCREILQVIGKDKEISITPVSSEHFKRDYFAPRPSSERLINRKLDDAGLNSMRDWKLCLREYLERDYPEFFPWPAKETAQ